MKRFIQTFDEFLLENNRLVLGTNYSGDKYAPELGGGSMIKVYRGQLGPWDGSVMFFWTPLEDLALSYGGSAEGDTGVNQGYVYELTIPRAHIFDVHSGDWYGTHKELTALVDKNAKKFKTTAAEDKHIFHSQGLEDSDVRALRKMGFYWLYALDCLKYNNWEVTPIIPLEKTDKAFMKYYNNLMQNSCRVAVYDAKLGRIGAFEKYDADPVLNKAKYERKKSDEYWKEKHGNAKKQWFKVGEKAWFAHEHMNFAVEVEILDIDKENRGYEGIAYVVELPEGPRTSKGRSTRQYWDLWKGYPKEFLSDVRESDESAIMNFVRPPTPEDFNGFDHLRINKKK